MRKILSVFVVLANVCAWASDTFPTTKKNTTDSGTGSIISPKAKGAAPAAPTQEVEEESSKAVIGSIGLYGTNRLNEVTLRDFLGKDLDMWLKQGLANDPSAVATEKNLVEKIKKKFGFPFAEWSIIQYFQPGTLELHLTLDVVEQKDIARRMPFLPEPKERLQDPGDLVRQWVEYEDVALNLVDIGEVEPEAEKCVALHCPFAHKHEKLKKYEKIFVDGVKKHASALLDVMKREKEPQARAAATYLLAYWTDEKKKVIDAMLERIRDPDAIVRNNAMRVLGDIAEFHTELVVPLAPLIPALDFPKVSDRSKALFVVYLLAANSTPVREELLKTSVPTLISLMECKQPDHREIAHNILRKISGKEFPATDARAWTAWSKKLGLGNREITKKP